MPLKVNIHLIVDRLQDKPRDKSNVYLFQRKEVNRNKKDVWTSIRRGQERRRGFCARFAEKGDGEGGELPGRGKICDVKALTHCYLTPKGLLLLLHENKGRTHRADCGMLGRVQ